jgi:hypothetical protein
VDKAIALCFQGLTQSPSPHRHHGTFFELRTTVVFALSIIAVSRCDTLSPKLEHDWMVRIQVATRRLGYWQDECAGVKEAAGMLDTLLNQH